MSSTHSGEQLYDLVVVSPPCVMFSMLQFLGLNRTRESLAKDPEYQRKLREAIQLLCFGISICVDQQLRGKFYLFEQPWNAMSWKQSVVRRLLSLPSTYVARADQCCFGLRDADQQPIRKSTGNVWSSCEPSTTLGNGNATRDDFVVKTSLGHPTVVLK